VQPNRVGMFSCCWEFEPSLPAALNEAVFRLFILLLIEVNTHSVTELYRHRRKSHQGWKCKGGWIHQCIGLGWLSFVLRGFNGTRHGSRIITESDFYSIILIRHVILRALIPRLNIDVPQLQVRCVQDVFQESEMVD
jgi:hypothetical protein